ncbi:MAG: 4Fe-4S binding protein [Coriobacteriia bacterium]|nr:4Fe-4S binding protein [Coriobacteriia bacterium]
MNCTLVRRQAIRRALLLLSFIAFPITINYFSPYLIVEAAFQGIVNGSLIVFGSMFVGSLVFGRLWCGWMCPAAGLQEPLQRVNGRRISRGTGLIKWAIWAPWMALIIFAAVRAGGYTSVQPLYGTIGGISVAGDVDRPIVAAYAIYLIVVLLFFGLAVKLGRRGGCHSVCWMAPFMIAGRAVRNTIGWPALGLTASRSACSRCGTCTSVCPMSVDVENRVASGRMEDSECVLCGTCVDACPNHAIHFSFRSECGNRSSSLSQGI